MTTFEGGSQNWMNTPHKHLDNSENTIPAITWVSGCWNGADSGPCCARRPSTPRACARRGPRRGCLAISALKGGAVLGANPRRWCDRQSGVPRLAALITWLYFLTARAERVPLALGVYRGGAAGVTRQVLRKFTSLLSRFRWRNETTFAARSAGGWEVGLTQRHTNGPDSGGSRRRRREGNRGGGKGLWDLRGNEPLTVSVWKQMGDSFISFPNPNADIL